MRIKNKRKLFSIEALKGWLAAQPPKAKYDFWSNDCLLGRYFKDNGVPLVSLGTRYLVMPDNSTVSYPEMFNEISENKPWTYGAALKRLTNATT